MKDGVWLTLWLFHVPVPNKNCALICNVCSPFKIRVRDWSKLITWFWCICRYRHDHCVFLPMAWKWPSRQKFKPLNIWIKIIFWAFTPTEIVSYQSICIYKLKWFEELFDARPKVFPPLKESLSLGFHMQHFASFSLVLWLFFKKLNSTLFQIYWTPDLQ